jgi:predicted Zn-dependent protease
MRSFMSYFPTNFISLIRPNLRNARWDIHVTHIRQTNTAYRMLASNKTGKDHLEELGRVCMIML